ncbi:hypothetical protein OV079_36520 [Nannocystis pusilla]|uniref:Uncharacterized protein n=1 Tax=Nannocystis pusilla TaxID=889268 RepID=A0A9X3EX69_9BACT|nr:hypothetical protein [Nannocystis pusilla]MCY1010980.1 hypothetical protein [Nannocystis pusilla]
MDQLDAAGDGGAGGAEVVAAGPGERLGVEVDADRPALGAALGPLGGQQRGAAEVLLEHLGLDAAHLVVDALDEFDVVDGGVDCLLIEGEAVGLFGEGLLAGGGAAGHEALRSAGS